MTTLADKSLLSGGDNKPPMLEKHLYDSWKSRMELYMLNRPHGRMILASVEKGPLVWPSITEDGVTRLKEYVELTPAEAIQADCDIKAINIILQGLPTEIYALVSQHRVAKDLWEKIKLLMQGTSLTKQERECKLYDEFDKFTYKKGETLHEYYLRFTLLLNDMNIYKMPLEQFQDLPLNVDLLHALPSTTERHAIKVRLMHERNCRDPLRINNSPEPNQINTSFNYLSINSYQQQQPEFSQPDSGLVVLVFQKGDDPIDAINHMMSFLTAVVTSRYPTTNNQLRTLSNPRQQATIYDGKVTVQPVQGRQTTYAAGTTRKYTPGASGSNTRKQRTVICYNCKGEGHIAKQCTKPKRKRDETWFNDKVLLVQAQASGQALTEEEIAFLADPGLPDIQTSQTVITHNAAYQADDLDAYDSDCDELNSARLCYLMAICPGMAPDALTENSKKQDNSDYVCVNSADCTSSDNLCVSNSMNVVKFRAKHKKHKSKKDIWKPTGKVFTQIGYIWRPTGRTFTIVGNVCPLTRITTTNEVPSRKPIVLESESPKPVVKLVYSRKPRKNKNTESVSKTKVVQIVLWYLDSGCSKHMTGDRSQLTNFISKFLGTVKFGNDQVAKYSVCSKSSKKPHKPKSEDTNQEKLYLLHMDLCGPMRVASVNGKKTDNGTEFVNQTLREYYEKVGISHETSVARSPQQNGVVERRNRTLIEAARTMLIYAKAPLFLWAEAVATACYTQNRSMIRRRHGKTPYELLHDKPPDLSYLHVFGALCYPTNDSENLGKLQPKADIVLDRSQEMTLVCAISSDSFQSSVFITISISIAPIHEVVHMQPCCNQTAHLPQRQVIQRCYHHQVTLLQHKKLKTTIRSHDVEEIIHDMNVATYGIHPLENIIVALADSFQTDLQSMNKTYFCYYDAFLTSVEPKNYKDALTQACWIEAMQEELHEFERLELDELGGSTKKGSVGSSWLSPRGGNRFCESHSLRLQIRGYTSFSLGLLVMNWSSINGCEDCFLNVIFKSRGIFINHLNMLLISLKNMAMNVRDPSGYSHGGEFQSDEDKDGLRNVSRDRIYFVNTEYQLGTSFTKALAGERN
ncbi:retrovirus-related pol polyprotein from transposon TNT 1-94 [Tanacetum coccineum]